MKFNAMNNFWAVLRWFLIGWGLLSLLGVLIWAVSFFGSGDPSMKEGGPGRTDKMTAGDVRFIMSTDPLPGAKLEKIIHSFESARAFTGDHRDAAVMKVTGLPVGEFEKLVDHLHASWIRGDRADHTIRSALETGRIKEWQPDNAEVLTANYFINPRTIVLHNGHLTAAELIYVNMQTQMVYYVSFKF
jgi:hypothetical protein